MSKTMMVAGKSFQNSEAKYRELAESITDVFFAFDSDLRYTYWNKASEELTGIPAKDALGKHIYDIFPDTEETRRAVKIYMEVLRTKQPQHFSNEYHLGGKQFFFDINAYPSETGLSVFVKNVTERKRVEAELIVRDNAIASSINAIALSNLQGDITYVNSAFLELWGYDNDQEVLGKPAIHFWQTEEKAAQVIEALSNKGSWMGEMIAKRKDGSTFDAQLSASMVLEDDCNPICMMASFIDVTERNQAEEKIRNAAEEWRVTFDSIDDPISIQDRDFRILRVNKAYAKTLNKKPTELIGKNCYELVHGATEPVPDCPYRQTKIKKTATTEFFEPHLGIHIQVSISPMLDIKGEVIGYVHIVRDITKRKEAEAQLIFYQKELRSLASQLSLAEERERHRFATELHDRVTQTLAICSMKLGELSQLATSGHFAKPLSEMQALAKQLIEETRALTFDLSSPLLYEFGLEAAVEKLIREDQRRYGILLDFEDDKQPKPLDEDTRILLFQAVRELLVNVAKHSQAYRARVCIKRHRSDIQIAVEDDGIGFDLLETSSRAIADKGFGLFSIRERLNHIGGHFKVESEHGRGTLVTIRAPLRHE